MLLIRCEEQQKIAKKGDKGLRARMQTMHCVTATACCHDSVCLRRCSRWGHTRSYGYEWSRLQQLAGAATFAASAVQN
jgi:hypothetical protein